MPDPQPVRHAAIAIAASFTADPILPPLKFVLSSAGLELPPECAPYNQIFQELLTPASLLATNGGGVNVLLIRIEDFVQKSIKSEVDPLYLERTRRELSDALAQFATRAKSPTLLVVFNRSPHLPPSLQTAVEGATTALIEHARQLSGIYLVTQREIGDVSNGEVYDRLQDELAHIPYTEQFFAAMALVIARKVHALRVGAQKVLVLDCDNTLWRGVIGEDGIDGIALTEAFLEVQRFAIEKQATGVLVCLASKNAERDVLNVLEARSDMMLKSEHIVSHRINWSPKSENLVSLANELNLGLDSFVFLDDNPVECGQVRAALPQVVTMQLPPEPDVASFLRHLWAFDKLSITGEDVRRTSLYRENAARQIHEESATDIAEFIESLQLQIDIASPQETEWPRVAQLTQRTNQFNFTTKRRTEPELRSALAEGAIVLRVNVRDRFGDYGLVGLVVTTVEFGCLAVDTFLLSCRVLGRGVEHALIRRIGELAVERDLTCVNLPYIQTSKNEPARAFAESIAADFRVDDGDAIVYKIPAAYARELAHRPGFDPEAVVNARKSEGKNPKPSANSQILPATVSRSDRYSRLALDLVSGPAVIAAMTAANLQTRSLSSLAVEPTTETERELADLWRRLLNLSTVGVDDDYFALGGTSVLAVSMFAEVARRYGVKLPLTSILESPTVRTLAQRIESHGLVRAENIVTLKAGGSRGLFLVHDGDGETLLYRNLARRMPANIGVFGIKPRRIRHVPLAHVRLEDMAGFYVDRMRAIQPHGPYLIGGLCAGGVIAYEMAAQLSRAGESAVVAIFDAAKPGAEKRFGRLAAQSAGRLRQLFVDLSQEKSSLLKRGLRLAMAVIGKARNFCHWQISMRVTRLSTRLRFGILRIVLARDLNWPVFVRELSVREIYDSAETRYVPSESVGTRILLLRAQSGKESDIGDTPYREIFADTSLGWSTLAPNLEIFDVEGGHSSMLQEPFVESLASVLTAQIQDDRDPRSPRRTSISLLEEMPS